MNSGRSPCSTPRRTSTAISPRSTRSRGCCRRSTRTPRCSNLSEGKPISTQPWMARLVVRRKIVLLIFDGLGDRPIAELGRQTPLQAARKEHLDWFAANGVNGLLDPIAPGIRPGSDTSHLALFGYDPLTVYTGRGPFEAAGVGIPVKRGDIAFRCNFATVDSGMRVTDRRAGRIREGTTELAKGPDGPALGSGAAVLFRAGTEHRAALVLRGPGLTPHVSDPDPHEEGAESLPAKATAPDGQRATYAVTASIT